MQPSGENPASQFSAEPMFQGGSTDDPATAPPQINDQRARYVVLDCMDAGKTREQIRDKLMLYGYSETDADKLIDGVEEEQRKTSEYDQEVRGDPRFLLKYGGGACVLGIAVTIICIIAAFWDPDLSHNPLWIAVIFIAWIIACIGARLFWRGTSL